MRLNLPDVYEAPLTPQGKAALGGCPGTEPDVVHGLHK